VDVVTYGQSPHRSRLETIGFESIPDDTPRDNYLTELTQKACASLGISYAEMTPIQRMFATHYRCPKCKMLPLYRLDLSLSRRARCGLCGHHVALKNAGKYGRVRKQIAFMLR
jgi:hypothetical protein